MTEDKLPEDIRDDMNKNVETAMSIEQAGEAVCFHFDTALYLSQFPELNEQLESHIAGWVANNPQYVEALEKMVHSLAAQLDLKVSKVDALVAEPLLGAYNLCGNGLGKCPPAEPVTPDCESYSCSVSPRP